MLRRVGLWIVSCGWFLWSILLLFLCFSMSNRYSVQRQKWFISEFGFSHEHPVMQFKDTFVKKEDPTIQLMMQLRDTQHELKTWIEQTTQLKQGNIQTKQPLKKKKDPPPPSFAWIRTLWSFVCTPFVWIYHFSLDPLYILLIDHVLASLYRLGPYPFWQGQHAGDICLKYGYGLESIFLRSKECNQDLFKAYNSFHASVYLGCVVLLCVLYLRENSSSSNHSLQTEAFMKAFLQTQMKPKENVPVSRMQRPPPAPANPSFSLLRKKWKPEQLPHIQYEPVHRRPRQ